MSLCGGGGGGGGWWGSKVELRLSWGCDNIPIIFLFYSENHEGEEIMESESNYLGSMKKANTRKLPIF